MKRMTAETQTRQVKKLPLSQKEITKIAESLPVLRSINPRMILGSKLLMEGITEIDNPHQHGKKEKVHVKKSYVLPARAVALQKYEVDIYQILVSGGGVRGVDMYRKAVKEDYQNGK